MKKFLIIIAFIASLNLAGCSLPWVHKIDVQQGNVITQEMIDQLEPGMTRQQVSFVMGSPMVVDVFHQERWDYIYLLKPGYGKKKEERVSLYFDNERLERITGDLHPSGPGSQGTGETRQTTVVVPPYDRREPGLLNRIWYWITFRQQEEP